MTFDLQYKKAIALVNIDSRRWFIETIDLFKALGKYDLEEFEGAAGMYASGSSLFSLSGISFSISRKFLTISSRYIKKNDIKSILRYEVFRRMYDLYKGTWDDRYEIDENLVKNALEFGELFFLIIYLGASFIIAITRGEFEYSAGVIEKMSSISEIYDYDWGGFYGDLNLYIYRLQKREWRNISSLEEKSLTLANKLGTRLWRLRVLGFKARAQILTNDLAEAQETLDQAKRIFSEYDRIAPFYMREYLVSQLMMDVVQLENLLRANLAKGAKSKTASLVIKKAHKSGRAAVKSSHKFADKMPETLRLMGTLSWLENKQRKALKFWEKSIKSAEHLGAKPDLARTYMEVGKRLLEKKSKFRQFDGIHVKSSLEKAGVLFIAMDLKWDLEELEKISHRAQSVV